MQVTDIINYISSLITDDPDIFEDIDTSTSSSSMSPSPGGSSSNQAMNQLLKAQEDQRKKSENERRKRVEPKLDKMNKTIDQLNASNTTRQQASSKADDQINNNIKSIQNMMSSLERDI